MCALRTISIVIPNYNGRKLLEENLSSFIAAAERTGAEYEIIIADDASTDDSIGYIVKNYPEIILHRNTVNRGFAPTANAGIKKARMDLVFLANNDITLDGNYFLEQFKYFEVPDTFGVMGRIMNEKNEGQRDGAKFPILTWKGLKTTVNYIVEEDEGHAWVPTFFLSGANALIDRKKLQEVGGFDGAFAPFYHEDVELSIRAWRLGWKCYYEHASICFHPLSATIQSYYNRRQVRVIANANKIYLHALHLTGIRAFVYTVQIVLRFLLSWIVFDGAFYK